MTRSLFWIVFFGLLTANSSGAQSTVSVEGGARSVALGGATTALPADTWGFSNPAAWATLPGRAVSFFASQAFGLPEMRLAATHYVEQTGVGALAGGARTFGFEDFRESHFSLGFARGFSPGTSRRFYAGVNLRYHHLQLGGNYGSSGALGLSVGGLVAALPSLHFGFHATNLNGPAWTNGEALPRTLAIGVCYAPGPGVRLLLDALKDLAHPLSARSGLEVHPVDVLALRVGVATAPTRFTAGAGLRLGRLAADLAAERHELLGWSPAASLSLQWQ